MPTPWPFEKSYEDSVGQGHKDDHEVELEARCKMISPVEFQEVQEYWSRTHKKYLVVFI